MDNNEHYNVDKLAIIEEKTQRAADAVAIIEQRSEGTPVAFLKSNFENRKIRERKSDIDFRGILSAALTKICALAAIKAHVSPFDAEDITKMILSTYADLTLEEIYKAFELERYGVHEVKTEHYGLFNAEYCAAILKKYRSWKTITRHQHNISPSQALPELSETAKEEIAKKGVIRVFEEFKTTDAINDPVVWIFDRLYNLQIIPGPTTPELQDWYHRKYNQAHAQLTKEIKSRQATINPVEKRINQEELENISKEGSLKVISHAKKIILTDYFRKLIKEGKHISDILP